MPENITLEQLQTAQNTHFAAQTADMNELKENTSAVLSTLSELANRVYGYSHDAKVAKDLETVYADIIEDNPELADLSAVGFTALLKDGDEIKTQGNIMYINGTQEEADYTFSGENSAGGFEICTVWYFENNGTLNCYNRKFDLIDAVARKNITEITSSEEFFSYAESVTTNYVLPFTPFSVRRQATLQHGEFVDNISVGIEEYFSNVTVINAQNLALRNSTALKRCRFPELISIGNYSGATELLGGCTNLITDDDTFPKLETIGNSNSSSLNGVFRGVPILVLPESLKTLGIAVSLNNKVVIAKFRNATSVADNWCSTTPTERFEMVDDWGASINIATAAANWNKTDFVDLFTDNLRNMDDEVREIKIPSEIYDSLTDDEFALAEDKGWTVGA